MEVMSQAKYDGQATGSGRSLVVSNSPQESRRKETVVTRKELAILVILVMIAPSVLVACCPT
jgi:hypothetical protein